MVAEFCEIAKGISGKDIDELETRICPDIVVGYNGKFYFSKEERKQISIEELETDNYVDYKTVVIVLESPHIGEFDENYVWSPTPAIGDTGTRLQEYFNNINLEKWVKLDSNYRVILMNSIQYQCCLGEETKWYRDYMWLKLWYEQNMSSDFVRRLKEYKPDVIFNCCTIGNHTTDGKNNLKITRKYMKNILNTNYKIPTNKIISIRNIVSDEIVENFSKVKLFEMNHPSSWWSSKNRKIECKGELKDISTFKYTEF